MTVNKTPNFPWCYSCGILRPCKMNWKEVPFNMLKQEYLHYNDACNRRNDYHTAVVDLKIKYRMMKEKGEIE